MTPLSAAEHADKLYEAALRPQGTPLSRAAWASWLVVGLGGLTAFAWAEPFSSAALAAAVAAGLPAWAADYVLRPLAMALRAVLLVEVVGYIYHRFFQHVGVFTRLAGVFRRNQRYHWIHHMIIYPIGRLYRRAMEYVPSEEGIAWSWVVPALLVAGAFLGHHGLNLGSVVFLASIGVYAKFIIDTTHSRFHVVEHPWAASPYFHWLERIHLLHHWDQRTNFTIVHPAMDWLFGTYLAPRLHARELELCREDKELTVSDLINWRYLLVEASPTEYAAFISAAQQHPRSLRKVGLVLEVLRHRLERRPSDVEAALLRERSLALLKSLGADPDALLKSLSAPEKLLGTV